MTFVYALIAGIGFVEILLRSPATRETRQLGSIGKRVVHVLGSKHISDHWKERVLLAYSGRIFKSTILIAISLIAAFVPLMLLLVLSRATGTPLLDFSLSITGIIYLTVVSTAYAVFRSRRGAKRL